MSKVTRFQAKKAYRCGFCGVKTKRPYSIVDGAKSCPKCDREWTVIYHYAKCPTCAGKGYLVADLLGQQGKEEGGR